jgi:predicted acylesterase/phospholipase RssA
VSHRRHVARAFAILGALAIERGLPIQLAAGSSTGALNAAMRAPWARK